MERYHIFKLGLAILFYAAYCIRPMVVYGQNIEDNETQTNKVNEEDLVFYQGVEGKPGVDFPVLSHIPRTSFNCRDVDSGYYADLETDCQVFHICEENKKISFLCPNGTIFQQSELICEWWFKVNCTNSPNLYEESAEQLREENARRKLSRRVKVKNHGAVMRMEERSSISVHKKVSNERQNRINNHAPTYRDDEPSNDLSRASSSDFVRDRKPRPFQRNQNEIRNHKEEKIEEEQKQSRRTQGRQNQRGRKPVQFQTQPSVDNENRNEETSTTSFPRSTTRRPAQRQKSSRNNNAQFGSRNRGRNYQQNSNKEESKPNNVNRNQNSNRNKLVSNNFNNQNQNFNSQQQPVSQNFQTNGNRQNEFSNQNSDFNSQHFNPQSQEQNKPVSNNFNHFQTNTNKPNNFLNSGNSNFNNENLQPQEQNKQVSNSFDDDNRQNGLLTTGSPNDGTISNNQDFNNFNNFQNGVSSTENPIDKTNFNDQNFHPQPQEQIKQQNNFNNFQNSFSSTENPNDNTNFKNQNFHSQFHDEYNPVSNNFQNGFSTTGSPKDGTDFNNQQFNNFENGFSSNGNPIDRTNFNNQNFHPQLQEQSKPNNNFNIFQNGFSSTGSPNGNTNFNEKNKPAANNFQNGFSTTGNLNGDTNFNNQNYNSQPREPVSNNFDGHSQVQKPASNNYNNVKNQQTDFSKNRNQNVNFQSQGRNNFNQFQTPDNPHTTPRNQEESKPISNNFNDNKQTSFNPPVTDKPVSTNFNNHFNTNQPTSIGNKNNVNGDFSYSQDQGFSTTTEAYNPVSITASTFQTNNFNNFRTDKSVSPFINEFSSIEDKQTNQDFDSTGTLKQVPVSTNTQPANHRTGKTIGITFPNTRNEAAFSTTSKRKDSIKLNSTNDSDEAQITQETASFYKNSFNRIEQSHKSTANPHPNHRETYSELKEPKYYSTKIYSAISSVTPQYLTTQPINNGRPFLGSQVGTTFKSGTTRSYFTTTIPPTTTSLFNTGKIETETTTVTHVAPTELFNVGRTDKALRPIALSTVVPFTSKPISNVTAPPEGSFNTGIPSTLPTSPKSVSSTGKVLDHATVYGKFVKGSSTTPSGNTIISLSKSVFGANPTPSTKGTTISKNRTIKLSKSLFGATPSPFSKSTSSTTKSAEILTASDSFNRGTPQVRFFGKVQTTKVPGVVIHFNSNSISTTAKPFSSDSTTPRSFSGSTVGKSLEKSFSTLSTIPNFSTASTPISFNTILSSATPLSFSTFDPEFNSVTPTSFSFLSTTPNPEINSVTPFSFSVSPNDFTTVKPFSTVSTKSGFYVTKDKVVPTQKSRFSEIVRPRPFELPPQEDFSGKAVFTPGTTIGTEGTPAPTYPTYKISSASPFSEPSTPEPTQPTPFTTTLPSTFDSVDSMINALAEMATHNFSSESRPGLVIPPSAGPQTLHTLAVYFANALDGIAADKEDEEEDDEQNMTQTELEKKKLTELLTQMTMDRYNELFHEEKEVKEEKVESSTITSRSKSDEDLEGQHSKGPLPETPKVRQLAKVFTQALSSYLDDPATFKKVLEEVRPTEPPELENEESTDFGDDELLNFSDADSKSSFPPFFPTPSPVRPTWGYLLAYNTSQLDVKNSINGEENLQGADSQSFVSQFNKLQKESTTKSSIQLPEDHWTSSPDANKLWKKAFSFDPASINENFGTTEPTIATTEEEGEVLPIEDHHEIKYELKSLPHLALNSTQVHGILIDFMNTTKNETNRLARILRKLNTTEDEFLTKMKEIEGNPLTKRLILLLINECGSNSTHGTDARVIPIQSLLGTNSTETLETASSNAGFAVRQSRKNSDLGLVDPSLEEDSQDARALQLLNSLYTIASRFGK